MWGFCGNVGSRRAKIGTWGLKCGKTTRIKGKIKKKCEEIGEKKQKLKGKTKRGGASLWPRPPLPPHSLLWAEVWVSPAHRKSRPPGCQSAAANRCTAQPWSSGRGHPIVLQEVLPGLSLPEEAGPRGDTPTVSVAPPFLCPIATHSDP